MRKKAQVRPNNGSLEWDIYTRISKDVGGTLVKTDRQERILRELAANRGLTVGRVWCDNNLSAWNRDRNRPGWNRLLERVAAGQVRGLLLYHDDRLLRHPDDCGDLVRASDAGGGIHTVSATGPDHDLTDPAHAKAMWDGATNAWYEVARISQRVKDKLRDKLSRGEPLGSSEIFGYKRLTEYKDEYGKIMFRRRNLCPLPAEADIIREIAARIVNPDGPEQWKSIADDLNQRGILTVKGNLWVGKSVRQMMSMERHGGFVPYLDDFQNVQYSVIPAPPNIDEGQPWPILDQETYAGLHRHIRGTPRGRMPATKTLMGSIIRCSACSSATEDMKGHMYGCRLPTKANPKNHRYTCPNCTGNSISGGPIDEMVEAAVKRWYGLTGPKQMVISEVVDSERAKLQAIIDTLIENIDGFYVKKSIDDGMKKEDIEQCKPMRDMRAEVARRKEQLAGMSTPEKVTADHVQNATARWAESLAERRRMVGVAVQRIEVAPTGHRGGYPKGFDYQRVTLVMRTVPSVPAAPQAAT